MRVGYYHMLGALAMDIQTSVLMSLAGGVYEMHLPMCANG